MITAKPLEVKIMEGVHGGYSGYWFPSLFRSSAEQATGDHGGTCHEASIRSLPLSLVLAVSRRLSYVDLINSLAVGKQKRSIVQDPESLKKLVAYSILLFLYKGELTSITVLSYPGLRNGITQRK